MAIEHIENFISVTPHLAAAGQPSEEQLRDVAEQGFEVVVNLGLRDPRYCLPDEAGLARALALDYYHIPVDFQAPRHDDLRRFFTVMDRVQGKKAFVHCAANMRVTSFVSLYMQARCGWSNEQAEALIARVWRPDDVWTRFIESARERLKMNSV